MSPAVAEVVSSWANWFLLASLTVGVIATFLVVVSGSVKETALKEDLAASQERTAGLERDATELRLEVAKATERTELERIARIKLQWQLGPRLLDAGQQEALRDALLGFAGRKVRVFTYVQDPEAAHLSAQIVSSLKAAGIIVDDQTSSVMQLDTFVTGILVSGPDRQLVNLLTGVFASIDLKASSEPQSSDPPLSNDVSPIVAASIFVGLKPTPIIEPTDISHTTK